MLDRFKHFQNLRKNKKIILDDEKLCWMKVSFRKEILSNISFPHPTNFYVGFGFWVKGFCRKVVPLREGHLWRPQLVSMHPALCDAKHGTFAVAVCNSLSIVNDRPCVVKSQTLLTRLIYMSIDRIRRTYRSKPL